MERFFYHSFPRRQTMDVNQGFAVLSSMLKSGLLLTPELVQWQHLKSGIPQKRVCFTELPPSELPDHAKRFGCFAIEFTYESLRELGGFPVFYVPNSDVSLKGYEGVGAFFVHTIVEIENLFTRFIELRDSGQNLPTNPPGLHFSVNNKRIGPASELATVKKTLDAITEDTRSFEEFRFSMRALQSLFYPTENLEHNDSLGYYRQREWRIIDNFVVRSDWPFRELTSEDKHRMTELDPPFFQKELRHPNFSSAMRIDECRMYTQLDGAPVMKRPRRIIVPSQGLSESEALVGSSGLEIPVIVQAT